jgi:hypothetical protein
VLGRFLRFPGFLWDWRRPQPRQQVISTNGALHDEVLVPLNQT